MLNCDHDKSSFIIVLLANNALIVCQRMYRVDDILHISCAELCSKLIKDGLHRHQTLNIVLQRLFSDPEIRRCEKSKVGGPRHALCLLLIHQVFMTSTTLEPYKDEASIAVKPVTACAFNKMTGTCSRTAQQIRACPSLARCCLTTAATRGA